MDYNHYYKNIKNAFGREPERILVDYVSFIPQKNRVLDIGAGQGRNSIYLSKSGFVVDAIDTSGSAIQELEKLNENEKLKINLYNIDFKNFMSEEFYSAILVFGLIQILDWDEIELLREKIFNWLNEGSLLFITAFTTSDESHNKIRKNSKRIGKNSYLKQDGEKRTFFEPGEIKKLFPEYKILHYWEGTGPEHRHGNSPVEKHSLVEAVFQK